MTLYGDWFTVQEAAALATRWRRALSAGAAAVSPRTIRSWIARGHLAPAGLDERGRQLFRLADLARAEHATRGRALRLVGLPERSK
ncbi:MerR family transcriptional regulator [Streptomyces leeuwenhoekii]|uniref:MerR family transcriptional regulator n=1 Tax=Streptomyces leeuwenhoekii TaxID=1437453 RepID=A0ABR5HUA6_STRLW|nr:MerR family transcriptional regulator [Streptomyces leeuwenhoekii]KMS74523.1 MerR family transcriptional regulator [Streptomyces leeuwenhoekii]